MNDDTGDSGSMKEPLLPPPEAAELGTTQEAANQQQPSVTLVESPVATILRKRSSAPNSPTEPLLLEGDAEAAVVVEDEPVMQAAPDDMTGELQPAGYYYRDKYFALAFLLQLVAVFVTAVVLGPKAVVSMAHDETNPTNSTVFVQDDDGSLNQTALISLLAWTPVLAMLLTMVALQVLVQCSHQVVTLSLFAGPLSWLLASILLGAADTVDSANGNDNLHAAASFFGMALLSTMGSLCLYCCYRRYLPFAAANLQVALTAVHEHKGLFLLSLGTLLALYGWFVIWGLAVLGVYYQAQGDDPVPCVDDDDTCDDAQPNAMILLLLVMSFYWTAQVLKNVLHTTTAGTVGSWWFGPASEATSGCCCSKDVCDSWMRATTYSFGSICFGSLVVALLQTLEALTQSDRRNGRRNHGMGMVGCILHCLLHCLRRFVEYMNSWAFVYVGLYGYDFVTSGKQVLTLFQYRGWTAIIADRLVYRVLGLVNVSIGILTGCAAVVSDALVGPMLPETPGTSYMIAFGTGLVLGTLISSTALFVVESSVRTVIVCFAASPAELLRRGTLYEDMTTGWTSVYPDVFHRRSTIPTQQSQSEDDIPEATLLVSN